MSAPSRTKAKQSRAAQSAATRVRIIAAASELFMAEGFLSSTMSAIAKAAGVSVQSLYLHFTNKAALLQAAFDVALMGDVDLGVLEQDWFIGVQNEPDGRHALQMFCEHGQGTIARSAPLFEVIRSAASDPEVAEVLEYNKVLRLRSYSLIIDAVSTREGFTTELTKSEALDVLYAVVSEDSYLLLVHERGWTEKRWTAWVASTVVAQLFPSTSAAS